MGNLLIHVLGTSVDGLTFELNDDSSSDLVGIWPIRQTEILWPKARPALDDRGADYVANSLSRIAGLSNGILR
jgi:hypothetical protein